MTVTRLPGINRGPSFEIDVNGKAVLAYQGETLGAVLLAAGIQAFSQPTDAYPTRRIYCCMGSCHQCLVTVNGQPNVQACRTFVEPGMKVDTQS